MWRVLVVVMLSLLVMTRGYAQALPVTPMQNAISGVMQKKMVQRGFAANDPRYAGTLTASGGAIAAAAGGGAAAIVVGTVTAPAWVTAAIAAGVGALVSYGVSLAIDGVTKWLFGSDSGNIQVVAAPGSTPPLVVGGAYWASSYGIGSTPEAAARGNFCNSADANCTITGVTVSCTVSGSGTSATCNYTTQPKPAYGPYGSSGTMTVSYFSSGSQYASATGSYQWGYGPIGMNSSGGATGPMTTQAAIDQLPQTEKAKPLNPEIIAAIANRAWQQAATQPGYQGLPYQASDPITAADAAAWQAANPNAWPSVGDFVAPQPAPSGGTAASPWQLPTSTSPVTTSDPSTSGSTSTNPGTGSQLNLGPDPGIGSPSLEQTPTATQILDPIFKLMPDLRSYVVPSHSGVCPKPSMTLWGKSLVLDGHCTLLDQNRQAIYAVMAAVWLMVALFIILAA